MESKIIIVDTNVLIDYLNGNKEVASILVHPQNFAFISCITKAELQQGAASKVHLNKINRVIEPFPIVEIDFATSETFSSIFEKYFLSNRCSIPDMLIASTALRFDIELFTFNTKDFSYIPKLSLLKHNIKPLKKDGWFL
jgi:predicted nucleic acid-binding protein